jgi:hypothetical protein
MSRIGVFSKMLRSILIGTSVGTLVSTRTGWSSTGKDRFGCTTFTRCSPGLRFRRFTVPSRFAAVVVVRLVTRSVTCT